MGSGPRHNAGSTAMMGVTVWRCAAAWATRRFASCCASTHLLKILALLPPSLRALPLLLPSHSLSLSIPLSSCPLLCLCQVAPGDEVLFVVATDNQGRNTAVQIVIQPRGTVSRVVDYDGVYQGVVEKALKAPPKKVGYTRERPEATGGVIIAVDAPGEDGEKEKGKKTIKVSFEGGDLQDGSKGVLPAPGDTVEFSLSLDKPKKKKFARHVRIVAVCETDREMGVVTRVKDGLVRLAFESLLGGFSFSFSFLLSLCTILM